MNSRKVPLLSVFMFIFYPEASNMYSLIAFGRLETSPEFTGEQRIY
jgi:hypothetical protein